MKTVYLDMDEVLVDFHRSFAEAIGESPAKRFAGYQAGSNPGVPEAIRAVLKKGVFENAPPTHDFKKFVNLSHWLRNQGHNVEILSSCMEAQSFKEIKRQKVLWLNRYGLGTLRQNFVTSGSKKQLWADADSILIDDAESNCKQFASAGGHSILHIDGEFEKTKVALLKFLKV